MTRQSQTSPRRARTIGRGFSLIELTAVLVIVAILSVTATMSMSGVPSNRQAMAVRQIARDLTWLRERAMSSGTRSWATFNPADDTYVFLTDNLATPGFANALEIVDPATTRDFLQRLNTGDLAGVDLLTASSASFGFDSLGRPVDTSGVVLTSNVTISVTGSRSATILAQTGRASWQ